MLRKSFPLALLTMLTAGCLVGPNYQTPTPIAMSSAWSEPTPPSYATTQPTTVPSVTTNAPVQIVSWWRTFGDPELDLLVERAFQSNLDLEQAAERVRQARAARGIV